MFELVDCKAAVPKNQNKVNPTVGVLLDKHNKF